MFSATVVNLDSTALRKELWISSDSVNGPKIGSAPRTGMWSLLARSRRSREALSDGNRSTPMIPVHSIRPRHAKGRPLLPRRAVDAPIAKQAQL